ncbi:MAG: hypothetical protein MJK10_20925 [Pseudomonadales bacterium]|nr:hypothetical protein [Pseudomonadales bacterium]NRA18614.1 hypothetical protein [Oceanospirillaceae bacterium]
MNKFEIHVLLAGFSSEQNSQLTTMLAPLPINIHCCTLDCAIDTLPKVHVLLVGMDNIEKRSHQVQIAPELQPGTDAEAESNSQPGSTEQSNDADDAVTLCPDDILDQFVSQLKIASPYALAYLMAPAKKILSLNQPQQAQYRDFIIYPVNDVFLEKRLFRIVSDLQEKFVQLIKKRRLKQILAESEIETQRLRVGLNTALKNTREANKHYVRLLSNQVFARMGQRASGRNQQLNYLLVQMAEACGLDEEQIQDVTDAWHLRNIGKMGFSDELLHSPYITLSAEQQRIFNCHPTLSHAAMMIVRPLDSAAKIVLQHKEYLDGSGYPEGLCADAISLEAQVLAVVNDYTELVSGRYSHRPFSTVEALAYLDNYATEKYRDEIVHALAKILPELSKMGKGMHDVLVQSVDLKIGMKLTRDLICKEGILLLGEGLTIDKATISRLQEMEMNLQEQFKIFIAEK